MRILLVLALLTAPALAQTPAAPTVQPIPLIPRDAELNLPRRRQRMPSSSDPRQNFGAQGRRNATGQESFRSEQPFHVEYGFCNLLSC